MKRRKWTPEQSASAHEGAGPRSSRRSTPQGQAQAERRKPRPIRPNQRWGIDMTKVMIEGFGWVYVVIVLDWNIKKVVGHYAGLQARGACSD